MLSLALLSMNMLMAFAHAPHVTELDISGITPPDLTGCEPAVISCFSNITSLILPSGCGVPPASVLNDTIDADTVKWAQCACPTLVPVVECLNNGISSCPALNATLSQFSPMIQSGCALIGNVTTGPAVNGTYNGTTTNTTATRSESAESFGFAVQVSLISFLGIALLL